MAEKIPTLDGSAADVAIPVLADVDDVETVVTTPTAKTNPTTITRKVHPNLPTISITKPPVPLPVELPTPRDIVALPSPPDSRHSSFDEDLESGRARGLPELPEEEVSVPRHISPLSSSSAMTSPPSPPPEDLMADSDSVLETTPIIQDAELPSSSPYLVNAAEPQHEPESVIDTPSDNTLVQTEDVEEATMEDPIDPDVTIRLVGGGGSSGGIAELTADEEVTLDGTDADADVASLASTNSVTSEVNNGTTKAKKHKKTKSGLAGLKKLGLGKKKSSVSSVKEAMAESK